MASVRASRSSTHVVDETAAPGAVVADSERLEVVGTHAEAGSEARAVR